MGNCRKCKFPVPEHHSFCNKCGARQNITQIQQRQNVFSRIINYCREAFRSDLEKKFDDATELARFGFDAAIDSLETIIRLDPDNTRFNQIMAIFYAGAGDEKLSHPGGFPGGPISELRPQFSMIKGGLLPNLKAEEIISAIRCFRQSEEKDIFKYTEEYEELNNVLDGSLEMYIKSIEIEPNSPIGYAGLAHAYMQVADGLLIAHAIFPESTLTNKINQNGYETIQFGKAKLGKCHNEQIPSLEFLAEVLWLYEQSKEEYKTALLMNPTDVKSLTNISYVFSQLGEDNEAQENINHAISILNKAIIADATDVESYSERADIFTNLDEKKMAISDLEKTLILTTRQYEIPTIKRKIEELRKE